jgi:hypothetical protein
MFLLRNAGKTSVDLALPIFDSSSAVGALLAGLVYNTASLTAYYSRQGASGAAVAISLVTKTKGTWVSGGFVAVDGTNLPGVYELGVPDAAFAAGAEWVTIGLKGAANMVPVEIVIDLKQPDVNVSVMAANVVTAAAVADAAIDAATFAAGAINAAAIASDAITAAKIADAAIDYATFAADCKTGSGIKANVSSLSDIDFSATMKAGLATKADLIVYRKNVAPPPIHFFMYDSTSPYAPSTGKTVTATRSIDGAAYGAGTLSAVTEIGNGEYSIQPAQADFNGDVIALRFTATGCRASSLVFPTK